ncbi:transposase domain-containing protein [Dinoroseobacter shibae]|uniref:transposase domain-containing protein n=1 Tax=Dinoroseobacter shibae TaxID=215813 RepID=UPI0026B88A38
MRIRDLLGIGPVPSSKKGALQWLRREDIPLEPYKNSYLVAVQDLPDCLRFSLLNAELEHLHLSPGTYDAAAHEAFFEASPSRRDRAERRAAVARVLVALGPGVRWSDRLRIVHEKFGAKGLSKPCLREILRRVEGIDPINFAPALLDEYKGTTKRAEFTDEAWRFFLTQIRDAAPEWPLAEAWRRTRDAGRELGWKVPPYITVYRRWMELSEVQKLHARQGTAETAKNLSIPVQRDKTSLLALDVVSLDGREIDVFVDWGDGKAVRPVMLVLVDVSSNAVLDFELAPSENATATVRLIKRACANHGIFDKLYTDNGSAFAGHKVAGGTPHRFRNGVAKGVQPMGICEVLGIDVQFALPGNAQAKIAERLYAIMSRSDDDGPDFKGAHTGHKPGARPNSETNPIPVDECKALLARGVRRLNREEGRRNQGAQGRSYDQVLRDGLTKRAELGRPVRYPTKDQLYRAGLIWTPATVDRNTQIKVDHWTYGGPETQEALAPYRRGGAKNLKGGTKILLARDPDDLSAPAIAYDAERNFICDQIEPVRRGDYNSSDGIREAARNRKAARDAARKAEEANAYLEDAEYLRAKAALDAASREDDMPPPAPGKVVGARFGGPLKAAKPKPETDNEAEVLKQFDRVTGFDPVRVLRGQ